MKTSCQKFFIPCGIQQIKLENQFSISPPILNSEDWWLFVC